MNVQRQSYRNFDLAGEELLKMLGVETFGETFTVDRAEPDHPDMHVILRSKTEVVELSFGTYEFAELIGVPVSRSAEFRFVDTRFYEHGNNLSFEFRY